MPSETKLFDLSNWSVITISGPDRKSFLHNFCTNEINKMAEGETCETFIPNLKGRILGHVIVINGSSELTLISPPNANETITPHLTKYLIGVEAQIDDRTSESAVIAIIGENAPEAIGLDDPLESHQSASIAIESGECIVSRQLLTKQTTYLVSDRKVTIEILKKQLLNSDLSEGTAEQFHQLRIEAGFPYVGIDLTEANIVQESARVKQTTSFTKGCYLGQEPIARLDAMGHTNKELRGFRIESDAVSPGAKILAEEKEVGELTSVAKTADGQSVGLGIVRIKHAEPGSKVSIVTDSGTYPAEIYWDHI